MKIAAITQDSHITANRHPSHSAKTLRHFQVFNNKFLTFLKHFTCTICLCVYWRYGTCFENFRWTKPLQNSNVYSIYFPHQNTKAFCNRITLATIFCSCNLQQFCLCLLLFLFGLLQRRFSR